MSISQIRLFVIVSNGQSYEIRTIQAAKRFPYRKYILKKEFYNDERRGSGFKYWFIDDFGKLKKTAIDHIEIQNIEWFDKLWSYVLVDNNNGENLCLTENIPDFPEFNFFTEFLFPQIEECLKYKSLFEFHTVLSHKKLNRRIEKLEETIEKLKENQEKE